MTFATAVVALSDSFRGMATGAQVLDALESVFRSAGASHFLVTGFPLPGRPIAPLIVRMTWGELRQERGSNVALTIDDPLLGRVFAKHHSVNFTLTPEEIAGTESPLAAELPHGRSVTVIAVPICSFLPYQGAVLAAGAGLTIETRLPLVVDFVCTEAVRRLIDLGVIKVDRPGDLSARERRVVQLSAMGKTANEIAEILEISQRTVHAHLQNASEKLAASNKTHTVVEALRYGQISI